MSVGTVTRNTVLRQGITYGTFWHGALAQQDTSERRIENLLYGNTYYLLYGTNHKSYIPEEKNKRAKNLLYDTVWHNRAQSTNQTYQCLRNTWCYVLHGTNELYVTLGVTGLGSFS